MRESGNAAMPLALQERDYIVTILKKCDGRIWGPGGAAEILNLPSTTLRSKMKKLGIIIQEANVYLSIGQKHLFLEQASSEAHYERLNHFAIFPLDRLYLISTNERPKKHRHYNS